MSVVARSAIEVQADAASSLEGLAASRPTDDGRPLRVTVCSAAVGCGHTRAAMAVRSAIRTEAAAMGRALGPVELVEALDVTPRWFTRGYRDGYLRVIGALPRVAGWMYRFTDRPRPASRWRGPGDFLEGRALRRFLSLEAISQADVIVTTHFLCGRVLGRAKQRGMIRGRIIVVATDQHPHAVWLAPGIDTLVVASDQARDVAISAGMDASRVIVGGIPIDDKFVGTLVSPSTDVVADDALAVRGREVLGLPNDRPIVVISGGGLGLGGIVDAAEAFVASARVIGQPVHLVVVCGKNEDARRRLDMLATPPQTRAPVTCTILGYCTRMPELLATASILITKPGGLTVSEACAAGQGRGLAMVLLPPLPGQEEMNARLLVTAGAAINPPQRSADATPAHSAGHAAALLVQNNAQVSAMRAAAASLAKPHAATIIARVALQPSLAMQA
jgi:processive 1,2-diacylglycerol beta-glucosyltransferase